jgi:hypothetical protein
MGMDAWNQQKFGRAAGAAESAEQIRWKRFGFPTKSLQYKTPE